MNFSNISLVKRNAEVGAEIASAISNGNSRGAKETIQAPKLSQSELKSASPFQPRVVCVGGSVVDTIAKSNIESKMIVGTSNPGKFFRSDGGVGRNVTEVLGRLGTQPLFYTAIGNDDRGRKMITRLKEECGVTTTTKSVYVADDLNTAQYFALLDHASELVGGVADMDVLSKIPIPSLEDLIDVDFLVIDANAPVEKISEAARNAIVAGVSVCFEPTSVPKARRLCERQEFLECVSYTFPNEDELLAMADASSYGNEIEGEGILYDGEFGSVKVAATKVLSKMKNDFAHVIATMGSRGVLLASKAGPLSSPEFTHFPADVVSSMGSSNGAGDTLCGAFIHALVNGANESQAVQFGMKAAVMSLSCVERAISPRVSSLKLNNYSNKN